MIPGLVASDLDGTLLRSDLTVSPRTVAALDRLAVAGVPFVMVTGRPIRWLDAVLAQTGPRGPVVCANGAVVYDPVQGEVLSHRPFDGALLADVVARLRRDIDGVMFAVEVDHGRAMLREATYPLRWDADLANIQVAEGAELLAAPVVKLLARAAEADPDELAALVSASLGDDAHATHSSYTGLVEISAAGVTKATGLAWVAERLGVAAEDTLAFGDMPNDVPMLSWAGHGVAIANAHPAARAAATTVTAGNDDDGVAQYLDCILNTHSH